MEIHLAIEFVRPTSVGVLWFNVKGYLNYMRSTMRLIANTPSQAFGREK